MNGDKLYYAFELIFCPDYFDNYICYVNTRHNYEIRASTNMELSVPFLILSLVNVLFLQLALRLWNDLAGNIRGLSTAVNSKMN